MMDHSPKQDITRPTRSKEQEARLGRILNSSANEIYIFDVNDLHFIEVNEGARRNFGFSPAEFSQVTPLDFDFSQLTPLDIMPELTPDSFERFLQPLRNGEIEHINLETIIRRKDGSLYPVDVHLQLLDTDDNPVFVAIVQDITERKLIQQALHESEERFNLAMRGANDGLWDWDIVKDTVYFSPRWKRMLGYEEDELENSFNVWIENVHHDDLPQVQAYIEAYLNKPTMDFSMEFRMRHKDGHYVEILSRAFGIRDEEDRVIRLVGTHVDMTESKHAGALLRESENKFRTIFDSTGDAIMLIKDGTFIDCNKAALNIFNVATRAEFCTYRPGDISPPLQPNGIDSVIMAEGRMAEVERDGSSFFEWNFLPKGGDEFPTEVLLTKMEIDGEPVFEATVRDISERKRADAMLLRRYKELEQAHKDLKDTQAQLLQSEKMASIGQLAAGVAHEINNPVGYVSSNMSSLKIYMAELFQLFSAYQKIEKELPDCDSKSELLALKEKLDLDYLRQDIDDLVDESLEGVHRVKKIVQDLKDFSHVDESEWQYADLHKGLNSTLNIVHNELKYKAEVIKEYGDLPKVVCMASQLNQVFMNLLINASHAIEVKGTVFIRTGQQDEDWVWVEIEDTGKGITPENLLHIFEPFFTTKEVGKGTGLGLSLAYGIIEKHHGRIEVESELGVGTCFRIWLPVENDEIAL